MLLDFLGDAAGGIAQGLASAASARQQMRFQERMSSTAHQREAADLEKAGLNRMLTMGHPGASTPQGAGFEIPDVMASANAARTARQAIANAKASERLTNAQTAKTNVEAQRIKDGLPGSVLGTDIWGTLRQLFQGMPAAEQEAIKVRKQEEAVASAVAANRARRERDARLKGRAPRRIERVPSENRPRSGHWSETLPSRRP